MNIMASKKIFNKIVRFEKPACQLKNSWIPQIFSIRPVSKHTPTSYTREKKLSNNFKPRWVAPTAMELNRRREKIAMDQKLRFGQEKIVKRSQFSDWNYSAEISAFQARLGEQFDEEKVIQAFKSREYLEDLAIQRRQTFGIENTNLYQHEGKCAWNLD